MNKRRLLKLADLLEADARNKNGIRFDLGFLGMSSDFSSGKFEPALDCGTSGCAMGLAAISGAFKYEGLSYEMMYPFWIRLIWKDRECAFDYAAMELFGITELQAHFLFTAHFYSNDGSVPKGKQGERRVAKRIRDLVAGRIEARIPFDDIPAK